MLGLHEMNDVWQGILKCCSANLNCWHDKMMCVQEKKNKQINNFQFQTLSFFFFFSNIMKYPNTCDQRQSTNKHYIPTETIAPRASKSAPLRNSPSLVTEKGESNHSHHEPSNAPIQKNQAPLPNIHYLINENNTLRNQLDNAIYHIQLERQEYQRRLRHLAARIEYLEEIDRLSHSPDQFSNAYYSSKKYLYNKKRIENSTIESRQNSNRNNLSTSWE